MFCLPTFSPIYPPTYLPFQDSLSTNLSVYLSIYLSIFRSFVLSFFLSFFLSIFLVLSCPCRTKPSLSVCIRPNPYTTYRIYLLASSSTKSNSQTNTTVFILFFPNLSIPCFLFKQFHLYFANQAKMIPFLKSPCQQKNVITPRQLSSDQTWLFLYIGDEILPSYIGIIISHHKDPVMNQSGFHGSCHSRVWFTL